MPVFYNSCVLKLHTLLRRLTNDRISIPDHQRDFVWSLRQQAKLVEAILRGKPVPSILLRDLDDDTQTLEDGQQRLRTMQRYVADEFEADGLKYSALSPAQQARIQDYDVIVVAYSGATDEEAREIFNSFQNGKPLTIGERLYSMKMTSPIVRYAAERLLTPGSAFRTRLDEIFDMEYRKAKGRRGADMVVAFALCAGLMYGIDFLSRKWEDVDTILHRDIDEAALDAKLDTYVRLWERVHQISPVTTKTRRNDYWNLGNFGGYIVYSLELHADAAKREEFNLPPTLDGLIEAWASHIADAYGDADWLKENLHHDLSAARSWKLARWANGLRRLFTTDPLVLTVATDSDDDDSI